MISRDVKKVLLQAVNTMEKKAKYKDMPDFTIVSFDFVANYTFVTIGRKTKQYQGIAKRNPNCDNPDDNRGLVIALNRAIHRMLDKKDAGTKFVNMNLGE